MTSGKMDVFYGMFFGLAGARWADFFNGHVPLQHAVSNTISCIILALAVSLGYWAYHRYRSQFFAAVAAWRNQP